MNSTPLEDEVRDALHRQVDPLQRTPLGLTDVRRRASGIRRRRAITAGAAIAAVLAIAVPVGLAATGPARRADVPPATQTPQVSGTVRIDPRSAPVGDGPRVPLIDASGPTLVVGDQVLDLPKPYDQITPFRDGWIAVRQVEGVGMLEVLDASFDVIEFETHDSPVTVSPDGTRVAWAAYNGDHWSVLNNDVVGVEVERPWTTLDEGLDGSEAGTIGFVSDDEVLTFQLDNRRGTISTFLADGDTIVDLPWVEQAVSASPATGMIAARATVADGRSCGATFDGRTRAPQPLWTDCSRTLADFNPDGSLVAAFPEGDQGSDGNPPGLSILDASTGRALVDFAVTGASGRAVGIATQVAWEDDETLLATYIDGNQQYVVRLGLDGTVERVAGPVTNNDFTVSLHLTPGTPG